MSPGASKIVGQVGVAPIPGVRRGTEIHRRTSFGGGGWILAVPKYAKNRDAAFLALAYLSQPGQSLAMALIRTTVDPWRQSALQLAQVVRDLADYREFVSQLLAVTEDAPGTGYPTSRFPVPSSIAVPRN